MLDLFVGQSNGCRDKPSPEPIWLRLWRYDLVMIGKCTLFCSMSGMTK